MAVGGGGGGKIHVMDSGRLASVKHKNEISRAVSCIQPGVAARVVGTARKSETGWCAKETRVTSARTAAFSPQECANYFRHAGYASK
jgi:hypothetical protein